MIEDDYVIVSQAAQVLNLTVQRVRQLIKSGQLPAETMHGRLLVISKEDLENFRKIDRPPGYNIDKRPEPKPVRQRAKRGTQQSRP